MNLVIAIVKLYILRKMSSSLFTKESLIHWHYIYPLYPHYIHILFIHYILLWKEILLIPKIALQNARDASQFTKNVALQWAKSLTMLDIFIVKWTSNDNSNTASITDKKFNKYILLLLLFLLRIQQSLVNSFEFSCQKHQMAHTSLELRGDFSLIVNRFYVLQ